MNVKINKTILNNKIEKKYLYIDEKGERNTKDKKKPNQFLVAGVSINEENRNKIIELVRTAKKQILPKIKIDKWELKGNTEYIFKSKDKKVKDKYNEYFSKKISKRKWHIWNKIIQKSNIEYEFFGVFIDNEKFINQFLKEKISSKKEESTILNKSYKLLLSNYLNISLWNESLDFTLIDNKNKIYEANNIITRWIAPNIHFDAIEGNQKKIILNTHNEFRTKYKNKVDIGNLNILKSNDFTSSDSLVMQFVDMQIYLLHRYSVMPNGNFLLDYEKLGKMSTMDKRALISLPLNEQKKISFQYQIAKNLLTNITSNIVILGGEKSSVIKISNDYESAYGNHLQASMILTDGLFT